MILFCSSNLQYRILEQGKSGLIIVVSKKCKENVESTVSVQMFVLCEWFKVTLFAMFSLEKKT